MYITTDRFCRNFSYKFAFNRIVFFDKIIPRINFVLSNKLIETCGPNLMRRSIFAPYFIRHLRSMLEKKIFLNIEAVSGWLKNMFNYFETITTIKGLKSRNEMIL